MKKLLKTNRYRYSFYYNTQAKRIFKSIFPCSAPPLVGPAGRQPDLGRLFILIVFSFFLLQSCVVYSRPVPVPAVYRVNSYEIAWENAQRAAEDVGMRITSADEAHGTIEGQVGQTAVTIRVIRLPDERIRLEVNLRGPSQESYIADEFHRAYQRRIERR
jgi:hypothetical protein